MRAYVSKSEIEEKIAEIKSLNADLEQSTADFTAHINEIQELLVGLKVCLNTTGGVRRIKDLSDIEFDTVSINDTISKINSININYTTRRENIMKILIDNPNK